MSEGKVIRHHCGYALWSCVFSVLGGDAVVVHYRDCATNPDAITPLIYLCPKCHQPLQMWWSDTTGEQARRHDAILHPHGDDLV